MTVLGRVRIRTRLPGSGWAFRRARDVLALDDGGAPRTEHQEKSYSCQAIDPIWIGRQDMAHVRTASVQA